MKKKFDRLLSCFIFLLGLPVLLFGSPRSLLLIDSQQGEPYESARLALVAELAGKGYSEAAGTLRLSTYSLANNSAFLQRVISMEAGRLDTYDAIVVNGTIALMAARAVWYNNPDKKILFMNVTDPVAAGVIDNFTSPPKANFTGISYPVPVRERLRFLKEILPAARRIGYLYADMPQSWSYTAWLEAALAEAEFSELQLVKRKIDFVPGENGPQRMALMAAEQARLMDASVDVFLAPNDQMGVNSDFARRLYPVVSKPIMALGDIEILQKSGALFSVFPATQEVGRQLARMVLRLFQGAPIRDILPQWPPYEFLLDSQQIKRFAVQVPSRYVDCIK